MAGLKNGTLAAAAGAMPPGGTHDPKMTEKAWFTIIRPGNQNFVLPRYNELLTPDKTGKEDYWKNYFQSLRQQALQQPAFFYGHKTRKKPSKRGFLILFATTKTDPTAQYEV
uniref:Uncharacterized protein n=1 Tax=Romanomermis culicivorax TaxID=13658 RepID=A0A915KK27_ROMCU